MILFRNFLVLLLAIMGLSGCLTSSNPPPPTPPGTSGPDVISQGLNTGGLSAELFGGNSIRLTDGALVTFDYGPDTERYTTSNLNSFDRDSPNATDYAFYGSTVSGSGAVYLINSTEDGFESAFAIVERTRDGLVPTGGMATYLGTYTGMLLFNSAGQDVVFAAIDGTVVLSAEFGATSTVSGTISGRERVVLPEAKFENVTLEMTSVINGQFVGTTSGGRAVDSMSPTSADAGDYAGFIVGDTAAEAVGSVIIEHTNNGSPILEVGGFVVGTVSPPMGTP